MKREGFAFGTPRECGRCHNVYPTDLERVHEHWYPKKTVRAGEVVVIPSTYCKQCQNAMTVESRRRRKRIAAMPDDIRARVDVHQEGPCACCGARKRAGERRLVTRDDVDYAFCLLCQEAVIAFGFDHHLAREAWLRLFVHNAREHMLNEARAEVSDTPRKPHGLYPLTDPPGFAWRKATPEDVAGFPTYHVECIWREPVYRAVLRWLTNA